MYHIIRSLLLLFVLAGTGVLPSCMQDDGVVIPEKEKGISEGFMRIHLNLPDLHTFDPTKAVTRAMNNDAERAIDKDLLSILVFKSNSGGEETFYYKAPISGSITYEDADKKVAIVTVKLVKSEDNNDRFRIVVVANHSLDGVLMTEDVTTKEEILEELVYLMPDTWNADDTNYTPFPMWGESENPVEIAEDMELDAIDMYRALARIDVGLNFESVDNVLSENALGLDAFKIKEIKVYRTYTEGFVAPLDASQIYTQPSIPSSAVRRGDNAPLEFEVVETGGVDQYVREIYLPEAGLPATPTSGNMHCIVVGGYYKGSTSVTYYRLNFSENQENNEVIHYPILRNHRYIFNILQITGPGYVTAAEALNSEGFAENMSYDLIVWDENIHELQVMGRYFLGLDNRNIRLAANKDTIGTPNNFTINYQTNYPLSDSDTLGLTWKEGSLFKAVWNNSTNNITISANTENVTNTVLSDTLYVRAGFITIPVRVEQAYVNFRYTIDCSTVQVNGTYTAGSALTSSNTIMLTLVAEDISIIGKNYIIETEDLTGDHGISFRAEGTFTATTMPVTLQGSGTLGSNSTDPFVLRITSNSSNGAFCEATITPVSRTLRILAVGLGSTFGYNIAQVNTGSNRVITSTNNFGPYDHSIVKTAGFELIDAELNGNLANLTAGRNRLRTYLEGSSPVDILHIGYDTYFDPTTSEIIANYLNNNGVVMVFSEATAGNTANIMNACFGVTNITQTIQVPAGRIYPLMGNSSDDGDPYLSDPVLNGPFGDVRGLRWGEDASHCVLLSNMPTDSIVVYSTGVTLNGDAGVSGRANMVTGFRHKTKNLLFFGDGGFTSSETAVITFDTACPFRYNTSTMFPVPHPTYGYGTAGNLTVYNSQIWCNAMAWAVDRATNHGINSGN